MKSKSFHLLWLGQSFANLGDVFYIVSLISILYSVTESSIYLALLPFLNMLGRFISGIISPWILHMYKLKFVLVRSQLSKTFVLFLLAYCVSSQIASSIWFIITCMFFIAFFDGWAMPATDALLPRLVEPHELMKANSFVSVISETIQLGGWALGGIFVTILGGQNVIWLTFALFVVSTIMMQLIVDKTSFQANDVKQKTMKILLEGWVIIWENPITRSIHIIIFIEAIANVVWIAAILYVFITEILNVTEVWWGYINTAFFLGLILGGIICSKLSLIFEKAIKLTILSTSVGVSIVTLIFGLNSLAGIALIIVFLSGLINQIKGITIQTYLQSVAFVEDLPKIYSAQHSLVSLVFGLSTLIFGGVADYIGVQFTFIVAGILLAVSALYLFTVNQRFSSKYLLNRED
ncbi:MFS transporter [Cytobacillus sp. FSL R5-0596]|uniref:MFS transporter n=1 Tax=Cytobacillus sp. FSL R5-0596 TaxID=2954696 RepID=UPI0030F82CEF